jgi:hypothetical protein
VNLWSLCLLERYPSRVASLAHPLPSPLLFPFSEVEILLPTLPTLLVLPHRPQSERVDGGGILCLSRQLIFSLVRLGRPETYPRAWISSDL